MLADCLLGLSGVLCPQCLSVGTQCNIPLHQERGVQMCPSAQGQSCITGGACWDDWLEHYDFRTIPKRYDTLL